MIELKRIDDLNPGQELICTRTGDLVAVQCVIPNRDGTLVVIVDHPSHGIVVRYPGELS